MIILYHPRAIKSRSHKHPQALRVLRRLKKLIEQLPILHTSGIYVGLCVEKVSR
jgi:hypothetical protein